MAADQLAMVAQWLAERRGALHQLAALGVLIRPIPASRRRQAAGAVLAALEELDAAGLVRFVHLYPMPVVAVLDRDGLRSAAREENL